MKRKFLLLVLIIGAIVTCVCMPASVFAADNPYYVVSQDLMLYAPMSGDATQPDTNSPVMTIPDTYYFKPSQTTVTVADVVYVAIEYDGRNYFVKQAEMQAQSHASKAPADKITHPAFSAKYVTEIADLAPQVSEQKIDIYSSAPTSEAESDVSLVYSDSDRFEFYGLYNNGTKTYVYGYITFTSKPQFSGNYYFDVAQSTHPDLTIDKVKDCQHAALESASGGDPNTPDPNDPANNAQNDIVRNILIAVIVVLCVAVVFLIFKPIGRRRKGDSSDNTRYQ